MLFYFLIAAVLVALLAFIKAGQRYKKNQRWLVSSAVISAGIAIGLAVIAGNSMDSSCHITNPALSILMWGFLIISGLSVLVNLVLAIKQKLVVGTIASVLLAALFLAIGYYVLLLAYLCFTF